MSKFKRIISLLLVVSMVSALSACGKTDKQPTDNKITGTPEI